MTLRKEEDEAKAMREKQQNYVEGGVMKDEDINEGQRLDKETRNARQGIEKGSMIVKVFD